MSLSLPFFWYVLEVVYDFHHISYIIHSSFISGRFNILCIFYFLAFDHLEHSFNNNSVWPFLRWFISIDFPLIIVTFSYFLHNKWLLLAVSHYEFYLGWTGYFYIPQNVFKFSLKLIILAVANNCNALLGHSLMFSPVVSIDGTFQFAVNHKSTKTTNSPYSLPHSNSSSI